MAKKTKGQKGKTKSRLSLSERRIRAAELCARGYTDTDIAKDLGVSRNTAAAYRKTWQAGIQKRVQDDPAAFRDVLGNTMKMLEELDQVRALAWKNLDRKPGILKVECDSCGDEMEFTYRFPPTDQAIAQFLKLVSSTSEQKAKLFGLLGVKQEVFIEIQNVNFVQNKMMAWLGENLNGPQREALAEFIESELSGYVGGASSEPQGGHVIDATAIEAIVGESAPVAG